MSTRRKPQRRPHKILPPIPTLPPRPPVRSDPALSANPTHTPIRNVRVADDLWTAAQTVAAARRETVSDVIRGALERYVDADTRLHG
jgi:Tfp pilus assembly protein FimV